jgi:3-dehydroquinate synthase
MGTYCPPLAVFLDTAFLRTLPQRHLSNGSAEILKMACIKDAQLFALLEQHSADLLATNFQVPPCSEPSVTRCADRRFATFVLPL